MENKANEAQKFLLDNGCGDLVLNDRPQIYRTNWIYASDIMMKFLEHMKACDGNTTNSENANCAIFDVSGSLPIEELRSKLLSMRFSKEEMRAADNEKAFEMYGFTDCINQLLEWLQHQRQ